MAAGPRYEPFVQNTGHEVVQAAQRMHLVRRVKDFAVFGALEPFARRGRFVVDKVREHRLVRVEKRLHVHDHVFDGQLGRESAQL